MEQYFAPLLIPSVTLGVICYVLVEVLQDIQVYTKATGFPSANLFFIGTFVSFYSLGIYVARARIQACQEENCLKKQILNPLLASSAFYLFFLLFCFNLTLRSEYFVNGARLPITSGAFWLVCSLLILLFLLAYSSGCNSLILFIPIVWVMFLIYNWSYKI